MSKNIAETFELLFDKNNNVAYKALLELQKESRIVFILIWID